MVRVENRRWFLGLLLLLVVAAWASLWLWGRSPYGRFLDHSQLADVGGADIGLLAFFVAGWTLMVFAMMLPTSLPLISLFHVMVRDRPDWMLLTALLIAGYLGVWAWFGVAAHVGDLLLHWAADRSNWLSGNSWVLGASILGLAGAYQFSSLKYKCLDRCRSPWSFILRRWTGSAYRMQALRLGIHHGVYCAGCCWPMMALMFVIGAGSIGWMLLLGTVMAAEKNLPWGRRLSRPVGVGLLAWGVVVAIIGLELWTLPVP